VEERLARWLLTVSDRMQSDQFPSLRIYRPDKGTPSGVTVAAGTLSQAGMIRPTGKSLSSIENLESTSCGEFIGSSRRIRWLLRHWLRLDAE